MREKKLPIFLYALCLVAAMVLLFGFIVLLASCKKEIPGQGIGGSHVALQLVLHTVE